MLKTIGQFGLKYIDQAQGDIGIWWLCRPY